MKVETFDNVWDAITDTPAEAANMTARSDLMSALVHHIRGWNLPQEIAATRLGITRPRVSDLLRGKIDKFSLDALVNLVTAAGLTVHIQIAKAA